MSSVNYTEQIIDTIQTLIDNAIAKADFDKTIKASIVRCADSATGKYLVKYQNTTFYAYSTSNTISFFKDDMVYILIPNGDMSQTKTILGSVNKLGTEYIGTIEGDESYNYLGTNCINNSNDIKLCSYKTETKILYDYDSEVNTINFNSTDAEEYIRQADGIICGAKFKTTINQEQRYKGNYGIIYTLVFKDNNNNEIKKSFVIDINKMTGMPYNQITAKRQFGYFQIDSSNFQRVDSIVAFVKDFLIQDNTKENDIIISDIELYGADRLDSAALANYNLGFNTPQGTYWSDSKTGSLKLQAQIRIAGKLAEIENQNAEFYWFREDNRITTSSAKYNRKGGIGWACLNEYNKINEDNNVYEWVPATYELTLEKANNTARNNKYKCVAVYNNDLIVEQEIVIHNYSKNQEISITSTNGTKFFDNGNTTLKCEIFNGTSAVELTNGYYSWSITDNNNEVTSLTTHTNSIEINVNTITYFSTYKCSVFDGDSYIGTADITLTNKMDESVSGYSVIINNGSTIYQYNEDGIAPNNNSLDNPIDILPLSVTVYDEYGTDITSNFNNENDVNIVWSVPKNNTMFTISSSITPDSSDDNYNYYHGKVLNYNILQQYKPQYKNNDIQVSVKCADNAYAKNVTNINFIKQGESGTSGTSVTSRIAFANNNDYIFTVVNGDTTALSKQLEMELYKDGEKTSSSNVKFDILKTSTQTNLTIFNNILTLKGINQIGQTITKDVSNVILSEVHYDNIYRYASMPIVIINKLNNNYDIKYVKGSGFRTVEYNSAGRSPQYDSSNLFKITVDKTTTPALGEVTFEWSVEGNLEIETNTNIIRPKQTYDGYNTANNVYCIIKEDGNIIGQVIIAIDMYLNRYGLAKINQWDGNSIKVDDTNSNSAMIISPQVGAGTKDESNKFSGLVMGTVKESGQTDKNGLIGYNKGKRTILLDADTGSAEFGAQGQGQIKFDGETATIEGGSYDEEKKTGLKIDLAEPSIKYGSGKFSLDKDGNMHCAGLIDGGSILSVFQYKSYPQGSYLAGLGPEWGLVGWLYNNDYGEIYTWEYFIGIDCYIPSGFTIKKIYGTLERMTSNFTDGDAGTYSYDGIATNLVLKKQIGNPSSACEIIYGSESMGGEINYSNCLSDSLVLFENVNKQADGRIISSTYDLTSNLISHMEKGKNNHFLIKTTENPTSLQSAAAISGATKFTFTIIGMYDSNI